MRAGWYERGGPAHEVITVGELPDPVAGAGEVLVRLHASGINPSDYKRRAGAKPGPRLVPHSDGAGVVAALGAGVSGLAVGQRVWVFNAQHERDMGTAAEQVALPAFLVRPLPDNASFAEGACFGIPAMTGHRAVFMDGPVRGQTVYVPGALSRVGAYCVQFAKWGGARVIAAASSDAKAATALELGADAVVRRDGTDAAGLAAQVLEATDGRGVDRVCEIEFGGNMGVNEKILAEGGVIASYASARAPKAEITVSPRRARNMSMHFIFVYTESDAVKDAAARDICAAQAAGALRHRIAGQYDLAQLADAHAAAESQAGTGHMIVTMA
jgi:NADPH2:quinone reductase